MGTLVYGPGARFDFDDRVLEHLKAAIGIKLRRQESFYLNWVLRQSEGGGRVSLWISPSVGLQFQFAGGKPPHLNREWVDALGEIANSGHGMEPIAEKDAARVLERVRQNVDRA
ncbi:hypothetical protein D9V32_01640 [Mycetocola tolaasinivorans]|uniref:DUF7882 domain-containing protein n=1 Tax=Mycetocola tolaasinivorans TaxID=76635 RepID=A0A3L7ACG8_9MICO|nr:hypothetical protein [Mycetocola tolaasinivorans]RLP78053.1 hypothetical protein D9V32_01640 [Mycetocola tolaasinivorans]